MTCGIYMIKNMVNSKIYIGQSVDIEKRWREHRSGLRGNDHDNKHLQNAWNKYGESNFEFTVICECDESQLNTKEIDYIAKLKTYDPKVGYNKTYGGEGGRHTEETRRKLSEAHKGKTLSEEHKRKMRENHADFKGENAPMYGKHHSKETRKRLSDINRGKTIPEETREKISENNSRYWKGKTRSEETREKISDSLKGRTLSDETRKKLSESRKGHIVSEATKKKISGANSKPIVQIDASTNKVINVWESAMDAQRVGGYHNGHISSCCKGKLKTHKGYKWQYLHEVD